MKHSRACCKVVALNQVDGKGPLRPKSFHEMVLHCAKIPEQEFKGIIHQCIIFPILGYRIRLRLKEFMLRRIAAQTQKYLERLKERQ
jgi:hypothetical protein